MSYNLPASARYEDATPILEGALKAAAPCETYGPRNGSYPSDLYVLFECPRRYHWDRTAPIKDDRSWFVTAEVGNHIHSMIVDWFKRAGLWRGDEVRGGAPGVNLSYRIDLMIADPSAGGALVPVEIKSCNKGSWEGATYPGKPEWTRIGYLERPGFAHYLQLQSYLHFNIGPSGAREPFPHGYLLYLCKNGPGKGPHKEVIPEFKMWRVAYDPATGEAIERALLAHEFGVINGLLPAASGHPDDREGPCFFCPYKARCRELRLVKGGE